MQHFQSEFSFLMRLRTFLLFFIPVFLSGYVHFFEQSLSMRICCKSRFFPLSVNRAAPEVLTIDSIMRITRLTY